MNGSEYVAVIYEVLAATVCLSMIAAMARRSNK